MMTTLRVAIVLTIAAATAADAVQESSLFLVFSQNHYVVPLHASSKRLADFVFHTGESVTFLMRLDNTTGTEVRLRTSGMLPGEIIAPKLLRVTPPVQQIPIRLEAVGPVKVGNARRFAVPWTDEITIPAYGSMAVPVAAIATPNLTPGVYEVRVSAINVACGTPCSIRNHGGLFPFEVRNGEGVPQRLDVLYRRAYRDILDPESAATAAPELIRQMLELYPTSSAAQELRAMYAERFGRWSEAASAYEFAAKLAESGQDSLRQLDPGELSASLKQRAAVNRQRAPR